MRVLNGCNKGTNVKHVNIAADWRQFRLSKFDGICRGTQLRLEVPSGDIWSDQKAVVTFVQDKRDGSILGFCRKELPINNVSPRC